MRRFLALALLATATLTAASPASSVQASKYGPLGRLGWMK